MKFRMPVAAAIAAVALVVPIGSARAAVIVVETSSDNVVGPLCDIRDAIEAANLDQPVGGCDVGGDGDDVIDLSGLDQPIELTLGVLPTIAGNLTITGPGARTLSIDGLHTSQVMRIGSGIVVISGVTLTNGLSATNGGCIEVSPGAVLTLIDSRVTSCSAASGGGIYNDAGTVRIYRVLVDANTSTSSGAGLFNSDGSFGVEDSTLSGNVASAGEGGGAATAKTSLPAVTRIHSSTIANNGAPSGANLSNGAGALTRLTHTLVAAPKSGSNCTGTLTSDGHNLASDASCGLTSVGDLPSATADLDVLADNGGPTPTHALLVGSPAIDAGELGDCFDTQNIPIDTDQRGPGFPRRTDGDGNSIARCDIGAFEIVPEPIASALGLAATAALGSLARARRTLRAGPRIG